MRAAALAARVRVAARAGAALDRPARGSHLREVCLSRADAEALRSHEDHAHGPGEERRGLHEDCLMQTWHWTVRELPEAQRLPAALGEAVAGCAVDSCVDWLTPGGCSRRSMDGSFEELSPRRSQWA